MARVLTPEDVLDATFTQTQFRDGYDEREVDEFLDAVVVALRHHTQGDGSSGLLMTSHQVESMRFSTTRFRRGYDPAELDAFLVDVAHTLREHASGRAVTPGTGTRTAPATTSPSGAADASPTAAEPAGARPSLLARLLRVLRGDPR